jgi:hypothetical protein
MEYYQLEQMDSHIALSGFMQGTASEVWGNDTHEVMQTPANFWTDTDV